MTNRFIRAYEFMRENEGGFSDHKRDKGGRTIYGVSSKFYPAMFYKLMNAKENEIDGLLKDFYYTEFWNPLYDKIFYEPLAIRLFDLGVNLGKKTAVRLLQNTFNCYSHPKIQEDGNFGNMTLKAVNLAPLDHESFYKVFIKNVESYYKDLPDYDVFGNGWMNRLHKDLHLS